MVRIIVVGRRTWRWTLTLAIVLGLGAWAVLGDMTEPTLTPEQIRAAWGELTGWVAGLLPGGGSPPETVRLGPPAVATLPEESTPQATPSQEAAETAGGPQSLPVTAGGDPTPAAGPTPERGAGGTAVPASVSQEEILLGSGYDLYRMDRARVRSERMELLREVLADTTASETRRADAQAAMLGELGQLEQELAIENLLRVQGYEGAVAILGSEGVEVVLPQVLDAEQASRLGGLVANVAGVGIQQVSLVDGLTSVR